MPRWLCVPPLLLLVAGPGVAAPAFERPGLGLNPDLLGKYRIAIEQGLPDATLDMRSSPEITTLDFNTLLRLRVIPKMEIQVGINSYRYQEYTTGKQSSELDGMGDSSLGLKLSLYRGDIFRAALLGGMLLDTASDAFSNEEDGSFMAISGGWTTDTSCNSVFVMTTEVTKSGLPWCQAGTHGSTSNGRSFLTPA